MVIDALQGAKSHPDREDMELEEALDDGSESDGSMEMDDEMTLD